MTLEDMQARGDNTEPAAGANEVCFATRRDVREPDMSHRWKRRVHVASTSSPTLSSQSVSTLSAVNA
jgi:hypothetical protein